MSHYRLSRLADADLTRILRFGIDRFGDAQAERYFDTLIERLDRISEEPLAWPAIEDIRAGLRRSVCGVHSIYYRIDPEGVLIVRILGREHHDVLLFD